MKYTFDIPFSINLKTIIMETTSHLHEGAQLKFYPNLGQRYELYFSIGFKTPLSRPGAPFTVLNNDGNLNVQLT